MTEEKGKLSEELKNIAEEVSGFVSSRVPKERPFPHGRLISVSRFYGDKQETVIQISTNGWILISSLIIIGGAAIAYFIFF